MKTYAFIFFSLFVLVAQAQTGIGTTTPHVSAKLDVYATNKGFLPPRVALLSTTDVATITTPAQGLVVYNTNSAGSSPNAVVPGYYYWDGAKWNGLVDQGALQSFSGYVPNYAQSNASSVTRNTTGDIVVSQSITTSGRPIQIIATGDANPQAAGAWVQLQLFRDGTAIGKKLQVESSASNENVPYCLNFIDNPAAGTYTYSVRLTSGGQSFQFGEADGNQITLLELGAWSVGNIPVSKGGTGVTTSTGSGSVVLSNNPTLETPIISSGNIQHPASIFINPTTHATSKRAAVWMGDWGLLQDFNGDGNRNFSITQNASNTYPTRFFINTEGKVGIGTSIPMTPLHIENGNAFGVDPGNTTSPSLYIFNKNNASTTAHSTAVIRTNGNGGGNPYLSLDIGSVRGYSIGIDNADNDKLKFHSNWNLNNSVTPAMTITNENRIGIGTTNPAAALHVASFVTQAVGAYGYLYSGGSGTNDVAQNINYSIQADSRIRSPEFNAISDARIKKNIFKLTTEKQLAELNQLKVVNYAYIDQLANGTKSKTGFIAQEVEAVNPKFVNQSTDFIPSVYALAQSATIENKVLHVTTVQPHGFQKGDEVKFYAEGKKEIIKTIEEVKSPKEFSVKAWDAPTENVFVYGKKVTDFRAIDFDQITALSVGAIQELSKQVEKLTRENESLQNRISNEVQKQQSQMEQRLLQIERKLRKKKR